jgi:hypothetical protein
MRRTKIVSGVILGVLVALVGGRAFGEDSPRARLKERMAKAHKGDLSPLAKLEKQLKTDSPDWAQVGRDAKVIAEVADAFRGSGEPLAYYWRAYYAREAG